MPQGAAAPDDVWNHNVHYYPRVLAAVPDGASRALDVGCGEGVLVRALARTVPHVVGLDRHLPTLAAAAPGSARIGYVAGDLLDPPFPPASFDLVSSVASLHHMDEEATLRRMASLLRPGGRLVVIGLANETIIGLPFAGLGAVAHVVHHRRHRTWESTAPIVWPPPRNYAQLRRLAAGTLPGATFRRHLLWRYSITWEKPRG